MSASRFVDAAGAALRVEAFAGKRVAYYFAAGWCPMCTDFEPALLEFRAKNSVELVLVSSDGSQEAASARAKALGMPMVPYAETAAMKKTFKIWAGKERPEFGDDRRSGVPAIVPIDKEGQEIQFLAAESDGVKVLGDWADQAAW